MPAKRKKRDQLGKNIFKTIGRAVKGAVKNQVLPAIKNKVLPAAGRVVAGVGRAALRGALEAGKATPFVSGAIRAGEELMKGVAQQGGRRKPRQYGLGRARKRMVGMGRGRRMMGAYQISSQTGLSL